MNESKTIIFKDEVSGDDAVLVVRLNKTSLGLCISLESDGDIEICMNKETAIQAIEALRIAVERMEAVN